MIGLDFQKFNPYFGSLAVAVILFLVVVWGVGKGQTLAQAETISQTAGQTQKALQYFYQDQNRYPSVLEFADQNTMLNYLTGFPLPELPSKACPQSFDYKKISDTSFQLSFCLPTATTGYQAGWNTLNGSPVSQ